MSQSRSTYGNDIRERKTNLQAIFSAAHSSPVEQSHINGNTNSTGVAGLAAPIASTQPAASGTGNTGLPELTPSATQHTSSALQRSLEATTSDADKVRVLMAEVERLQAQNNTDSNEQENGPQVTGLRRRGGGSIAAQAGEKAEVAVEKAKEVVGAPQGVPLEVVVALVVAVFISTYLFF